MEITNNVGAGSGFDNASNAGGGLYVYKKSKIAVCERKEDMAGAHNLMP
jgi:hypothetical protein